MFLGEYHTKFSGQGRVVLPKKLRSELGEEKVVVLSRGLEGCIWGFSEEEFQKEAGRQLEVSLTERRGRDARRYLFSAAEGVELDDQGRFVIPKALLEYAGLKEEVVVIGAGDHFEIWIPQSWRKMLQELENQNERVS